MFILSPKKLAAYWFSGKTVSYNCIFFVIVVCGLFFKVTNVYSQNNLDQIGFSSVTPAAVFSLRKMSNGYTGSAIRVRRSSDNVESDIGFDVAGDLDIAGLIAFTGATNSAFVVSWYDQSGYGRNATQTTSTLQPRIVNSGTVQMNNGRPTVVFSGGQRLAFSSFTSMIINAITRPSVNSGGLASYRGLAASATAMLLSNESSNRWGTYPGGASTVGMNANSDYILTMDGGTTGAGTFYTNGAATGTFNSTSGQGGHIGGTPFGGQEYFGSVSEIIFLNDVISAATRLSLEINQASYYGIALLTSNRQGNACSGVPFSYTATSGASSTSFSWTRATVSGITNAAGFGSTASISETLINTTSSPVVVTYNFSLSSGSSSSVNQTVSVTVNPSIGIATQPTSLQTVCNGTTANLSVAATGGAGAYTYQWYRNASESNTGGSLISGATGASFTVPGTTSAGNRYFYVVITDASCTAQTIASNAVTVTTRSALAITTQPAALSSLCNNTQVSISAVIAGGTSSYTYQWYSNSTNQNTGGILVSGATSSSYTVPATTTVGMRYYYLVTTDNTCSSTITSDVATVQTNNLISVTMQPIASAVLCNNEQLTISNAVSGGSLSYTYQWYSNSVNNTTSGTAITGANTSSYVVPGTTTAGIRYFYSIVTDAICNTPVTTTVSEITTRASLQITTEPASLTVVCNNSGTTISAVISGGSLSYTYQWYTNTVAANSGGNSISGANTSGYNVPATGSGGDRFFFVTVSDVVCSVNITSTVATIRTNDPLTADVPSVTQHTICNNTDITLNASASGGSTGYLYQWYSNNSNSNTGGTLITGATAGNYIVSGTSVAGDRYYYTIVTDASCSGVVTTEVLQGSTRAALTVATQPAAGSIVCNNTSTNLSVAAAGGSASYQYQWYINSVNSNTGGTAISGAVQATYSVPGTITGGQRYYYVIITDANCSSQTVTSAVSVIETNNPLSITSQPPISQIACNNTALTIDVTANGGSGNYQYQWYSNIVSSNSSGTSLGAAASFASYSVPGTTNVDDERYYYVTVSDAVCGTVVTSDMSTIITSNVIGILSQPVASLSVCNNTTAILSALASEGSRSYTYQWYSNSSESVIGGTMLSVTGSLSSTVTIPGTTISGDRYYYAIITDAVCGQSVTTTVATVSTLLPLTAYEQPVTSQTVCNNTSAIVNFLPTGGSANYSYQWYFSNANINSGGLAVSGATTNQYTVPGTTTTGNRYFYAVITDALCGTTITSNVSRVVTRSGAPLVVGLQPIANRVICINSSLTLNTLGGGGSSSSYTYQWYQNSSANNSGGTAITGQTTSSFSIPANVSGVYYYYVVITDVGCGNSISSNVSQITVNNLPSVSISSATQVACQNVSANQVQALITGGGGNISYQWYSNTVNDTTTGVSVGAVNGGQTVAYSPSTVNSGVSYYYVKIAFSGLGCGSVTSVAHKTTVNPIASENDIVITPQSSILCAGLSTTLSTSLTQNSQISNPVFTWYRDNALTMIAGSGQTFNTGALTNTTSYFVRVEGSNTCGNLSGTGKIVTVTIGAQAPDVLPVQHRTVCSGMNAQPVQFSGTIGSTIFSWTNDNPTIGLPASGQGDIGSFLALNNTSASIVANISVTPMANGCSGVSQNFSITIHPVPVIADTILQVCSGRLLNLYPNGAPDNTKFSWTIRSFGTGTTGHENNIVQRPSFQQTLFNTQSNRDTSIYVVTPSVEGCAGSDFLISTVVAPTPNIPDQILRDTLCSGNNLFFTPTSGIIYPGMYFKWQEPSLSSPGSITGATAELTGQNAIRQFNLVNTTAGYVRLVYNVIPVNDNGIGGCTGSDFTLTTIVAPAPVLSDTNTIVSCNNALINFVPSSLTNDVLYSWVRSGANGISNAAANGSYAVNEKLQNTTDSVVYTSYEYNLKVGQCSNTQIVRVRLLPTFTLTSATADKVCSGTPFLYFTSSNNPHSVINWTRNSSAGIRNGTNSGTNDIYEVLANSTTEPVTVVYQFRIGMEHCFDTNRVSVTVNPIPSVDEVSDITACHGSDVSIQFTGSPVTNTYYNWRNSNTGIGLLSSGVDMVSFTTFNTSSGIQVARITVEPVANGCKGDEKNFSIIVSPSSAYGKPAMNLSVCSSESFRFIGDQSTSANGFTWVRESVPGVLNPPSTGQNVINESLINETNNPVIVTYKLISASASGCYGDQLIYVTVNPVPKIVSERQQRICTNSNLRYLPISNISGTNFSWQRITNTTLVSGTSFGQGEINEAITGNANSSQVIDYLITAQSGSVCFSTDTVSISIHPQPTVNLIADQTICSGDIIKPIQFSSNQSGTIFRWFNSEPSIGLPKSGNGDISSFIATSTSGRPVTAVISVVPELNGCVGTAAVITRLTVNSQVSVGFIESAPLYACEGQPAGTFITSTPYGGDGYSFSFQWESSKDGINFLPITVTGTQQRKFTAPPQNEDMWYRAVVSSGGCKANTDPVKVIYKKKPSIKIESRVNKVSIGGAIQVFATGASNYKWSPAQYLNNANSSSPLLSPITTTRYYLSGTDQAGCTDTTSILIEVFKGYTVVANNILTPNGDGYNDTWKIKNIEHYPQNSIQIYNANSMMVKQLENYANDWDGSINGSKLPTGTYYYIIKFKDSEVIHKGFLSILN